MDSVQIITTLLQDTPYLTVVTAVVTLASAISAIIPAPKEGTFWVKIFKFVNLMAVNVGNAKNKV